MAGSLPNNVPRLTENHLQCTSALLCIRPCCLQHLYSGRENVPEHFCTCFIAHVSFNLDRFKRNIGSKLLKLTKWQKLSTMPTAWRC